jgi:2-succinyl-5-enolpyruvyl-6-hydroxy-3-cyclohexene-1-carboxylate synthase
VFVLIDNDGGAIFHMLPVREHEPHFSRYFATPHGLDLRHAAEMHGVALTDVEVAEIEDALEAALAAGRTAILRVRSDRDLNHRRHREIADAVPREVLASLETTHDPPRPETDDQA